MSFRAFLLKDIALDIFAGVFGRVLGLGAFLVVAWLISHYLGYPKPQDLSSAYMTGLMLFLGLAVAEALRGRYINLRAKSARDPISMYDVLLFRKRIEDLADAFSNAVLVAVLFVVILIVILPEQTTPFFSRPVASNWELVFYVLDLTVKGALSKFIQYLNSEYASLQLNFGNTGAVWLTLFYRLFVTFILLRILFLLITAYRLLSSHSERSVASP